MNAAAARAEIAAGALRGDALRSALGAIALHERDGWFDAILGIEEMPEDGALPRGSVGYLPASVDLVLRATEELPVGSTDHFVDVGSGLGRAVVLAHWLTGCRASGLELQPHLVAEARQIAARMNVENQVEFMSGDASKMELEGDVFFFYAPFNGETLTRAIASLERLARKQTLRIAAVHLELGATPWLEARASSSPELTFYTAR